MPRKNRSNDGVSAAVKEGRIKSFLMEQPDLLLPVVQEAVQPILEVAMAGCLQAGKHERSQERAGCRSGCYRRRLITRVGTIVLRVPQDRAGQFSTQVFEQDQRSEKALVAALAQMPVQGVSTRKVAAITEELCGHALSASSIGAITARLDEPLAQFSRRRLEAEFPYVVVDARCERVREGGVIVSRAVLIALGIDWEGRRQWLEKWSGKHPKLCVWVEANIEEAWTFYRLPAARPKHLKSTNLLERFNQELRRRTLVVRSIPDEASCLRLIRAVAAEQHEERMEGSRHLNTDLLREHLKPMKTTMAMAA
jgi:transposase-like protein